MFCTVLLVASVVIGAGLLQNIERIDQLEQQLGELASSYRGLMAEFTSAARPVFAENHSQGDVSSTMSLPNNEPSIPLASAGEAQDPPWATNAQERNFTEAEPVVLQHQTQVGAPPQSPINIEQIISQLQETAVQLPQGTGSTPAASAQLQEINPAQHQPANGSAPSAMAQETDRPFGQALLPELPQDYTIQAGDTLSYIARLFYGSVERVPDILELNNITDPDAIRVGDIIRLPRR
jgi:nucleoid-associated protein YgaU